MFHIFYLLLINNVINNSSWDRWILEEQILKDTEVNRGLQAKLLKEAIKLVILFKSSFLKLGFSNIRKLESGSRVLLPSVFLFF